MPTVPWRGFPLLSLPQTVLPKRRHDESAFRLTDARFGGYGLADPLIHVLSLLTGVALNVEPKER